MQTTLGHLRNAQLNITESDQASIMLQAAQGAAFLHAHRIVHTRLTSKHVGTPRGTFHAGGHRLFNADVRSILMVLWCSKALARISRAMQREGSRTFVRSTSPHLEQRTLLYAVVSMYQLYCMRSRAPHNCLQPKLLLFSIYVVHVFNLKSAVCKYMRV